ncbi:MAG: thiamine pyrophosphate-dependent dehydrogenase E1 component subunit alpha [Bacteroidetes bacterium]|nr:thiamine pyrophosphate-dependent dehydrogenase E1 component subunit alpha [Bacteroidota bacterium]
MDKKRLQSIYEIMLTIRYFEDKALNLFETNQLHGSVHLCTGQEAVAATVCSHLRDEDYITSTHRGHGHCIAKGADPDKAMAELMGKATGYCQGRGGSMHIADVTKGNLGANAIVGAGLPIATGAALSAKMRKTDQVAVTFFGDGASNEGVFHEALNLASVWKLPIIFVCENNQFGISTHVSKSTSVQDIAIRAKAYDIPGEVVDGNDVFSIETAIKRAIKRAKAGEGPSLIECKTYRWYGHWTGDPQIYRSKEDVDSWKEKCPIKRLETYFLANNIMNQQEIDDKHKKAANEITAAAEFAINSQDPDPAFVLDNVYSD